MRKPASTVSLQPSILIKDNASAVPQPFLAVYLVKISRSVMPVFHGSSIYKTSCALNAQIKWLTVITAQTNTSVEIAKKAI